MDIPLADRLRPRTIDDVVGQKHLLGEGMMLRRVIESGQIPNMIFYGPSGTGKTTVASIVAARAGKTLHKLNGTAASTADIRQVLGETDTFMGMGGVLLYLDEIQYLNKKQQQSLLEYMENGRITLIASTTENPYFYIYNAILSRSTVFEFKPVEMEDVERAVERAFRILSEEDPTLEVETGVAAFIARTAGGDVRKSLNAAELCAIAAVKKDGKRLVSLSDAEQVAQRSSMRYDRDADEHYDILSAFQKSIRGSDPDAGLHYLARLLTAGDLLSACRRLLVIAAEDVGLAYPQAMPIVKACVDSALQLGLPEAQLPLGEAVVLLATAPKSNASAVGIWAAMAHIKEGAAGNIPDYLKDGHYSGAQKLGHAQGYQYAHEFPGHYVKQQYLPDTIKDAVYYRYGDNKNEQAAKAYWDRIKGMADGSGV